MKNVKLFFVIALLMLITVGLFAGRVKFTTGSIYAYNSTSGYCQLTASTTLVKLTTASTGCGAQATITNCSGVVYGLYLYSGTTYAPLYFIGC